MTGLDGAALWFRNVRGHSKARVGKRRRNIYGFILARLNSMHQPNTGQGTDA